jgi:predicted MPP superfamily phosphohydrolase
MTVIIILSMVLLLLCKAYFNTKQVVITDISVLGENAEVGEGAQSFETEETFKVMHLSDLHLENNSVSPDELYNKLQGRKIDLIALTGDFLDQKKTIPKLVPYLRVLQRLNPEYGVYAVFGNHDYFLDGASLAELRQTLEDHGCKVMQNENVALEVNGRKLNIIGIDDYCSKKSDIAASFRGVKEGYRLVLTHDPNIVLDMKGIHYDYLLSGHFHGGQINWPKPYHLSVMGDLVKMNMVKGLHIYDGKPFYINEGLGQTLFNIRVGSRPEITIHDISLTERELRRKREREQELEACYEDSDKALSAV